jgi:hypothetical protein
MHYTFIYLEVHRIIIHHHHHIHVSERKCCDDREFSSLFFVDVVSH